jgi:hypothetical protein
MSEPRIMFDDQPWPATLAARAVDTSPPRLFGYAIEDDLARHYAWHETLLLALTGALPSTEVGRAFGVAMTYASVTSVAEAPTHAASLVRLCMSSVGAVLGTGVIGSAEQARSLVHGWAPLLEWLAAEASGALPACAAAKTKEDDEAVERLRLTLGEIPFDVPALALGVSREGALLALLYACGLHRAETIEVALSVAKIPTVLAEALAMPQGNFRQYPMNLPRFEYVEGKGAT